MVIAVPAENPTAVLRADVADEFCALRAESPIATLPPLPSSENRALNPIATLLSPVVIAVPASYPISVL